MTNSVEGRQSSCSLRLRRQLDQILRAAQGRLLGLRQIVDAFLALDFVGNPPAAMLVAIAGSRRRWPMKRAGGWRHGLAGNRFFLVRPRGRTTRPAADRTSRSCCRRDAAARGACGALAAPAARWPSAILPATARPTASAPPGRRAARQDREGVRHPCSCPIYTPKAEKKFPRPEEFFPGVMPCDDTAAAASRWPGRCPTAPATTPATRPRCSALGIVGRREAKSPFLQPPVIERQPVAVPPQQLDSIAAATAEHEQVARERIIAQAGIRICVIRRSSGSRRPSSRHHPMGSQNV